MTRDPRQRFKAIDDLIFAIGAPPFFLFRPRRGG
jgi:hypothetical protein